MNKEVVKELIQHNFTKKNLIKELNIILDVKHRTSLIETYNKLEEILGGKGASENTAMSILSNFK
jgi:lipid-A-disaccharide synthase